jgi:hypothetical protein
MIATALFNPVALMPRHTIPVTRHTIPVTRHTIPIVVIKGQTIPIVDYGEFT